MLRTFKRRSMIRYGSHLLSHSIRLIPTRMAVHSKDVVRSPRDSKILLNWDEYFKLHQESDKREKKGGATRTIDLRFTERISNSSQAIDIGIYRATVTTKDGKSAS